MLGPAKATLPFEKSEKRLASIFDYAANGGDGNSRLAH
jgi:hypothetical protein